MSKRQARIGGREAFMPVLVGGLEIALRPSWGTIHVRRIEECHFALSMAFKGEMNGICREARWTTGLFEIEGHGGEFHMRPEISATTSTNVYYFHQFVGSSNVGSMISDAFP